MKKLLLKTMLLLCALIVGSGTMWAAEPYYTLNTNDCGNTTNSNYANAGTKTVGGIGWSFQGNGTMAPWRLGGKSLKEVDRVVKTTTAMGAAISSLDLTVGAASSITVNSLTLVVASDASFNTVLDEVSGAFEANSTISFKPTSGSSWAKDAYYKFVFKVSVTGSSNKFVEFSKVEFYEYTGGDTPSTTAEPSISGNTLFLNSTTVTIKNADSADGADIYYTLNGDDPTTTTSETCFAYSSPFEVSATTTVKAIAKKSTDTNASSVVSKTFTKIVPKTVGEALTAIAALAKNGTIANQCVSGVVSTTGSISSGAVTYYISADGTTTSQLQVYKGKGIDGADFTAETNLEAGDEVVVFGTLKNYNGNTPEFDAGSQVISRVTKAAPTFSLDPTSKTLDAYTKESVDVTLTTNTDGEITCESNNEDVATVALKSGNVYTITAKSEGTATITIRSAASATYKPASATVAITVEDERAEAGISFTDDEKAITWGDSFTGQALTNDNSVDVVWSSTDEDVATVNSTGAVEVLKAGTTTIKATFVGDATYKAAVASYTLTINKANAGLSYTTTSFDIMLNDDTFEAPTLNNPNGLTVTYASNKTDVATVNTTTGELSYVATAEGTAKITATFAGNDWFKAGSANYTINIVDPTVKGSKYNPYTVAEVIDGTATGSDIYVRGFIVGEYVGKTTNPRTSGFTTDANIAISEAFTDSPTASGSIPVALPSDALKSAWGCKTTSGALLGYEVLIKGDVATYFSVNGIKNTDEVSAVSVPVTVGTAGYTTYTSTDKVTFPSGVKGYIVTATGANTVTLVEKASVPASTPIIIEASAGTYNLPVITTTPEDVSDNILLASDGTIEGDGSTIFALGNKSGVGFYLVADGQTVPAGKAYLSVPAAVKGFLAFDFGNTDAIKTVQGAGLKDAAIFNLAGQRMSRMHRGVNLVNGKKIILK